MNTKRGSTPFVLVLMLLIASAVGAYELKSARWPSNAANYRCDSGLSSAFCDSVKYGAERWNAVSGSPFRWLYSSGSQNIVKSQGIDGKRGKLGRCDVTRLPSNPSILQKIGVVFDNAESWYTGSGTPSSSKYDVRSIATHEMGHCLGLEHTQKSRCKGDEDDDPTMCEGLAFYDGETYLRTLETDDKNGVKARYPNQSTSSALSNFESISELVYVSTEVCDTQFVDSESEYAVLSPRQRLRYSEVIVRGTVLNVTATRFNSDDNCTWSEPDGTMGNWSIFYTVELTDVEAIRDNGHEVDKTLTITILEKNPTEKDTKEEELLRVGDEIVAYLTKGQLQWHEGPDRDVFYPASSPKTSFLIKDSDGRFYEVISEERDEGQTFTEVRKSVDGREYHPHE